MTARSKQIIPDLNAVARCLDPEILKRLDRNTFIISDFLEIIKQPNPLVLPREKIYNLFDKARTIGNYSNSAFLNDLKNALLEKDTNSLEIITMLADGINCNLLQPDGTGWQKGKLKICFEFVPEQSELIASQPDSVETHHSPLDEIRQLSNELTSMASTEQN